MISPSTIEKVKELSIVDVISQYIDLQKSGSSYKSTSPFSNENTPSFFVVPSKNIFKCFSSNKGGDAIKFVMEKEDLSYPQAIEDICRKCNIAIEYDRDRPKEHYEHLESLYKINQAASKRYASELFKLNPDHEAHQELFARRQFTQDTILQWELGYAPGNISEYSPNEWRFLTESLTVEGNCKQGIELGLLKANNDITYDAYRHRLIFPIIDHHGRYSGFGARSLKPDQFNAKYLNSSDSKVFNKSKILYGLHFAAKAIRREGVANLVEGYTDVISFHQASLDNTVGTCGTSITEDQCALLKRYTNHVKLFYDGDEAGQKATLSAIDMLMTAGIQTMVVPMPDIPDKKVDPDELVRMFSNQTN